MIKAHNFIKNTILSIVDFFYPLFKKFMPLQTFRYAACGGGNVLWGIFLYAVGYNFIFQKQNVDLGHWPVFKHVVIKSYIAADYLFALWINFFTGFYLNRYIVFIDSSLQKRVQLFRYGVIVILNMVFNYLLLKLFVQILHLYPTPSKVTATAILIVFSYYSQKYFSFKEDKLELEKASPKERMWDEKSNE